MNQESRICWTHLPLDKMATISQTIISGVFWWQFGNGGLSRLSSYLSCLITATRSSADRVFGLPPNTQLSSQKSQLLWKSTLDGKWVKKYNRPTTGVSRWRIDFVPDKVRCSHADNSFNWLTWEKCSGGNKTCIVLDLEYTSLTFSHQGFALPWIGWGCTLVFVGDQHQN